jgi:hypothetical protein
LQREWAHRMKDNVQNNIMLCAAAACLKTTDLYAVTHPYLARQPDSLKGG